MKKRLGPDQIIPLLFITGGSLMLLSVVFWYAFSSSTLPVTASSNANLFTTSIPAPEIKRVSLINAKVAFDKKQAFFIDVRDSGSYAASHIPGATNIPISDLDKHLTEIPRDRWIITYCTIPAETSSARAAQTLVKSGFQKVNAIQGGFEAWINANYPVDP